MEVDRSNYLLDLPDEMLEKIVDYLPFFAVRKKLRLTCKRLYHLCNSEHFCRDEVIVWPMEDQNDIIPAFQNSTRSCFNMRFKRNVIYSQRMDSDYHHIISMFFEQHGAKVRSLSFINCRFSPRLLESIIVQCDALCSLSIDHSLIRDFSFKSSIIRPTVTFLELVDTGNVSLFHSQDIFHEILAVFPCLKRLNITTLGERNVPDSIIWDFVMNFRHLEALKLNISLKMPLSSEPKLVNFLPKLKKLHLSFDSDIKESPNFWKTLNSRLNASSIRLHGLDDGSPNHIDCLLSITNGLDHLSYSTDILNLAVGDFKALVSSQLKTIILKADYFEINTIPPDLQLKANVTVTDLTLLVESLDDDDDFPSLKISSFITHFHGLVRLKMGIVTDDFLQNIYKYQKNLRSLILENCSWSGLYGFCRKEDDDQFGNSIADLQSLEYLSISKVDQLIIESKDFQRALNFPRLKYLKISMDVEEMWFPGSDRPVTMLQSCINLEAVKLQYFDIPSSTTLLSLFQTLKHLNYLRLTSYDNNSIDRIYVNFKHFCSFDVEELKLDGFPEIWYYDEVLDRTVFTESTGRKILHSPEISCYNIDWICV